jgi:hypothetical protein
VDGDDARQADVLVTREDDLLVAVEVTEGSRHRTASRRGPAPETTRGAVPVTAVCAALSGGRMVTGA